MFPVPPLILSPGLSVPQSVTSSLYPSFSSSLDPPFSMAALQRYLAVYVSFTVSVYIYIMFLRMCMCVLDNAGVLVDPVVRLVLYCIVIVYFFLGHIIMS